MKYLARMSLNHLLHAHITETHFFCHIKVEERYEIGFGISLDGFHLVNIELDNGTN